MANSILQAVAVGVREQNRSKRDIQKHVCINYIEHQFKTYYTCDPCESTSHALGLEIDYILDSANPNLDWTKDEVTKIILHSAKRAFGDPMLTYEQKKLRQHCTQYYNPMAHPILIEALGIPDEEGNLIKYVSAGGLVNVPTGYTLGGKRSTISSVAPQLKQCDIVSEKDNQLDVTPTDFIEWIKYYPYQLTDCCNKAVQWSDSKQALVCTKCNTTVIIHTDKGLVWHS